MGKHRIVNLAAWMCLFITFAVSARAAEVTRLALYTDAGASTSSSKLYSLLIKNPAFAVTRVKASEIRAGKLKGFDAVLFPGGSASRQAAALTTAGLNRVRAFVKAGGGYVGFCAGAYLASSQYTWSLAIMNSRVVDREHWARGYDDVQIRLTEAGRKLLGRDQELVTIAYRQGPLLAPGANEKIPAYRELASYATEVAKKGAPRGVMIGTSAIATAQYGKGRVLCFSPHPELTPGMEDVLYRGVAWAAGKAQEEKPR